MENCVFCKIVEGTLPSYKVYEDGEFLAFLDIHPLSPGHTLVIPKQHHRYVWDVQNIGTYFVVVQKIAHALQQTSGTPEVHMCVVGEEVFHAHVWVYPSVDKALGDKNNFDGNATDLQAELAKSNNPG